MLQLGQLRQRGVPAFQRLVAQRFQMPRAQPQPHRRTRPQNRFAIIRIERHHAGDKKITAKQAAEAELLIEQRKQNTLAEIAEKATQSTAALRLDLIKDTEAKIEATRLESIRKIDRAEKTGAMNAEQAALSRVKANEDAAKSIATITANIKALQIDLIKDTEAKIKAVRLETIRKIDEELKNGVITAQQAALARVKAETDAEEQIRRLKLNRDAVGVETLQIKEQTTGNGADKEALIRAEADLKIKTIREKMASEISMRQEYADQIVAIQQRMNQQILDNQAATDSMAYSMAQSSAGQMLDILRKAGKDKTAIGKTLFIAERALAVATIIMNTEVAAKKAEATLGPFGIPMSTYIRTTGYASAGMVAGMALADAFGGGRQYGGGVSADKMYRVNETGQPEMFTASNGRQYMMPNTRGEVTPANELGGSTTVQWNIVINNSVAGTQASAHVDDQSKTVEIAISEVANQISTNSGQVWMAMRSSTNIEGKI